MDDIVQRLRRWPTDIDNILDLKDEASDEIERLRAVLDAVGDLHDLTSVEDPRCSSCGDWPCPTHLIVCDECKGGRRG